MMKRLHLTAITDRNCHDKELKEMDMSQLRPLLKRKAKIKGPPPPVPKKPQNTFAKTDTEKNQASKDSELAHGTAFEIW